MRGKIQFGDWFSLRIRTLILLWIFMIGCGFHVGYVKYNQTQIRVYGNEESINTSINTNVNPESSIPDVNSTSEAKRSKRSPSVWSSISNATSKVGNKINKAVSKVGSTASDVYSSTKNKVETVVNEGKDYMNGKVKNITNDLISSEISEDIVNKIALYVINEVNSSGILDQTTNQLTVAIVGDIFYRVDEILKKYIRSVVRFIVRIYGLIGVGSSALGIYGIHTNHPNCLIFSVFFFQFTIVSEVLLMCEINVDLDMGRKVLLLSELVRIDWIGLGVDEDPMMLINSGILLIIAVTFYFLMTVKECKFSMMKKNIRKEIDVDEDLSSDIDLNDYQKDMAIGNTSYF